MRSWHCAWLACAISSDGVTKEPHLQCISPALQGECNTARAGSDKRLD